MICSLFREYKLPFPLHEYQKQDISYLASVTRSGNFSEVGLGKTIVSIAIALIHGLYDGIDKILIVTPPALTYQ